MLFREPPLWKDPWCLPGDGTGKRFSLAWHSGPAPRAPCRLHGPRPATSNQSTRTSSLNDLCLSHSRAQEVPNARTVSPSSFYSLVLPTGPRTQ